MLAAVTSVMTAPEAAPAGACNKLEQKFRLSLVCTCICTWTGVKRAAGSLAVVQCQDRVNAGDS